MRKIIELTGKRFDYLEVLDRVQGTGPGTGFPSKWICRCDCGKTLEREMANLLRNPYIQSCGCKRGEGKGKQIPIGTIFGYLIIVEEGKFLSRGNRKRLFFKCQCKCGKETKVLGTHLREGHTQSCGCLHKEIVSKVKTKDITGKRYGHLTVISKIPTTGTFSRWRCKCDCGNNFECDSPNLLRGSGKQSCGCLQGFYISKSKFKQIPIGTKFGDLIIVGEGKLSGRWKNHKGLFFRCKCKCGKEIDINGSYLRSGHTRSCGCLHIENAKKLFTKHGLYKTKEYKHFHSNRRREFERKFDGEWTTKMGNLLFSLQPKCVVCNSEKRLSVDHVLPLIDGNGLRPGNAVVLCTSCNTRKNKKKLENLSPEVRSKIQEAARNFLEAWERSQTRAS